MCVCVCVCVCVRARAYVYTYARVYVCVLSKKPLDVIYVAHGINSGINSGMNIVGIKLRKMDFILKLLVKQNSNKIRNQAHFSYCFILFSFSLHQLEVMKILFLILK
jgi:hypothetical protein